MTSRELLEIALFVEAGFFIAVLAIMIFRRVYDIFPQVVAFLAVQTVSVCASIGLLFFRKNLHLDLPHAYLAYFVVYWISVVVTFVLQIMIIYSVFAEAMRPMSGLHAAGKIIFRWVGVVSALVTLALVIGPNLMVSRDTIAEVAGRLQQGVGVLTLCLLVFVCFAIRPLGLTFRSHIFGVSLGMGIASVVTLIQAAWLTTVGARSVYSPIYTFSALGLTVAVAVWGAYFAMPEPERKMILLPTTSPFFFWNRISEILGDAPGHVAVAGFKPDMLAPAEIEMLTAATAHEAADRPAGTLSALRPGATRPDMGPRSQPSLAL